MNKNISRVAALATAVALAGVALTTPAYAAGSLSTQSNGSYGPAYIYASGVLQDNPAVPGSPVKSTFAWSDNIFINAAKDDITSTGGFTCPAGSDNAIAFLSRVGSEGTRSAWLRYGSTLGTPTPFYVNVKPEGLAGGGTQTGPGAKALTGDFSLGVACMSAGNSVVDRTFFRSVSKADTTGDFTTTATDYVYNAPALGYTEAVTNAHPGLVYTGDTLNATLADSSIASGFAVTYQWYANGTAVDGQTAATYLTTDNDAGKVFTVKAIYTRSGYPTVQVQNVSGQNRTIVGAAVVTGDVPATATIYAATNGALSLSLPSSPSITLTGSRDSATNTSISTGTLSNVQVIEGRVVTRDGWDLNVSWTNFVKNNDSAMIIDKSMLGISTTLGSSPAAGNVQSGTARVSGAAYPASSWVAAYQAKQLATNGNVAAETVGTTTLSNTFTLTAPQWKPAGTYLATVTYTVASR